MAIYQLPLTPIFPQPAFAEPDGLLAVGGDLSSERLRVAYQHGIFPWYSEDEPICWWSPDPRFTLFPEELHIARRLRRTLRSQRYTVRYDTSFETVVHHCATTPRAGQPGTWITSDMQEAYSRLHNEGIAHSIESWNADQLAGGLYGIALGGTFFGESMFSYQTDASKVAFVTLVQQLMAWGFDMIDCQLPSPHLARFGARSIPRSEFLTRLHSSVNQSDLWGGTPPV